MRAHPISRLLLIVAAAAEALAQGRETIALAFAVTLVGYLLLFQWRLLRQYILAVIPFVAASAALWVFVLVNFSSPDFVKAAQELVDPGSRFFLLLKMLASTSVIVLALGSVPDGEFDAVLRRMGFPKSVSLIFASGLALALTVRDAFDRSVIALRAQGLLGPSIWSKIAALGRLIALTWISTLSTSIGRAETKWSGNRFLTTIHDGTYGAPSVTVWDTFIVSLISAGIISAALQLWTLDDVTHLI
jgi:hypothetical protein